MFRFQRDVRRRAIRRTRGAGLQWGILIVGVLGLSVVGGVIPSFAGDPPKPDLTWWFPSDLEPGMLYDYRLETSMHAYGNEVDWKWEQNATFTVSIGQDADKPGSIVRLHRVADLAESGLASWLSTHIRPDGRGLRVTKGEVFFREGLLVRGPWRLGDRFSVITLAFIFFDKAVGVGHYDVLSVDDESIHLASEFWLGRSGPEMRGEGDLRFTKDTRGLTAARFKARWTGEDAKQEYNLSLTRKRIYRAGSDTPKSQNVEKSK